MSAIPTLAIPTIAVSMLRQWLEAKKPVTILDVRPADLQSLALLFRTARCLGLAVNS